MFDHVYFKNFLDADGIVDVVLDYLVLIGKLLVLAKVSFAGQTTVEHVLICVGVCQALI